MPQTKVVFFQDEDQTVPALDWLRDIKRRDPRITAKFHERILELGALGWEMTRPASDTLRDGIHELRVRFGTVNYRLLYSFHEQDGQKTIALLVHGLTKERAVPPEDIDLAVRRRAAFAAAPGAHTYIRPIPTPRRQGRE
jgi:putative component of toxin-antitoxin plasmid stabilization module